MQAISEKYPLNLNNITSKIEKNNNVNSEDKEKITKPFSKSNTHWGDFTMNRLCSQYFLKRVLHENNNIDKTRKQHSVEALFYNFNQSERIDFITRGFLKLLQTWNSRLCNVFNTRNCSNTRISVKQAAAIRQWIATVMTTLDVDSSVFAVALVYMHRYVISPKIFEQYNLRHIKPFEITFITCVIIAAKFHDDQAINFSNSDWHEALNDAWLLFSLESPRLKRILLKMKAQNSGCNWASLFSKEVFNLRTFNATELLVLSVVDWQLNVVNQDVINTALCILRPDTILKFVL